MQNEVHSVSKNQLPWVENAKHLGIFFQNKIEGMRQDIRVKRAKFIDRNNDLNQEYYFAHPRTNLKINSIYNTHFTGSQVWDLFSQEAIMKTLQRTLYNTSTSM